MGRGARAMLRDERKIGKHGKGPFDAIASASTQFDEIVGSGDGDQKTASGLKDTPEFSGVHARGDRQDDRKGGVRVRQKPVGVRDNPLAGGITARGRVDGGDGDINAMGVASAVVGKRAEIVSVAAAGVEDGIGCGWLQQVLNFGEQRSGQAAIMQPAARGDGFRRIAGALGTALLRLEKIDVAGARDIERVARGADQACPIADKLAAAMSDSAEKQTGSLISFCRNMIIMDAESMRRAIASKMLVLLLWPLAAAAMNVQQVSGVPACCRRDGKHHCEMEDTGQRSAPGLRSARCAFWPVSAPAIHEIQTPVVAPHLLLGSLLGLRERIALDDARAGTPIFERCDHQRGPPSCSL